MRPLTTLRQELRIQWQPSSPGGGCHHQGGATSGAGGPPTIFHRGGNLCHLLGGGSRCQRLCCGLFGGLSL